MKQESKLSTCVFMCVTLCIALMSISFTSGCSRQTVVSFESLQVPLPKIPVVAYLGCFSDSSTRALPDQLFIETTIDNCINTAKMMGYKYAGLQYYGYCFAGNTLGYAKLPESDCNTPCTLESQEICGGSWANSVYSTGNQ